MSNITVGTINTKQTATEPKQKANIQLRPYFAETDKKFVQYLFYSGYFNLVPQAVLLRLKSPYIVSAWVAILASVVTGISAWFLGMGWPRHLVYAIQGLTALAVVGGGAILLFWYTDKFDVTYRVMEGVENDLKEPDVYYRGTPENVRKGNFWVLTLNDDIVGCIGLDQNTEVVMDNSVKHVPYVRATQRPRAVDAPEIHTAEWKKTALIMAHADDIVRIVLVGALDIVRDVYCKIMGISQEQVDAQRASQAQKVLFEAHKPNEASVRRLAVKLECQKHGLSTVLLKRVAFWAHANQIEYLYADTDELQTYMANILVKKHGYVLHSTKKLGYFKTKKTYRLDVKLWMSQELERRAEEKREEDQKKEDEELKQYE